ncbi:sister chromatid cohesion protein PDS5-like protein, partial [Trifolium medium]|nr:sister chromatid cohesion protein PDS5-like protein [Trifolium medium]
GTENFLECDALISEMFQHFLKAIREHHPDNGTENFLAVTFLMLSRSGESKSKDTSSLSSITSVIMVSLDEKHYPDDAPLWPSKNAGTSPKSEHHIQGSS